jgi:fluoroquinolone resistance protein
MKFEEQEFEDIQGQEFEDAEFARCIFIGSNAPEAKFIDCEFETSSLSSVKIDGAVLQAIFRNCKIEGINFFTAKREVLSLSFENCLIRYSSFAELKLKETSFTGSTMEQVDFADADLTQADFTDCSFADCTFRNTNLTKADFRRARGYQIDPRINKVKSARFDVPEVLGLLSAFEIKIED